MRVLLDESVPRQLAKALSSSDIAVTAFPRDCKQRPDATLLEKAERLGYDVLVTNDKRMRFQQNLTGRSIALLVLPTNTLPEVISRVQEISAELRRLQQGEVGVLSFDCR
jgi:predicted nuclease of predicted toxin-antitoxin system